MDALPSTTLARFQIGQNSTTRKRSPLLVAGLLTAVACVCPTPSLCGTQVSAHGEPAWPQDSVARHGHVPTGVVTEARHGAYANETAEERQHNGRGQHQAKTGRSLAHSGSSSVVLLAKRQDTASAFRFPAASLAGAMALVFLSLGRNALFERTRPDDFELPLLQTAADALPSAIFPEKLSVAFILLVLVAAAVAAPIQAKTQQPAAGGRSKRNTGILGGLFSWWNPSKEQQSTVPAATPAPTGRGEVVSQLSTSVQSSIEGIAEATITAAPTTGGQQQEVEERPWLSRLFLMSGSEKKATEEEQVSFLTYLYNLAKKQPEAIPKAGPPPVTCSMENGRLVTHIGKGWREADSRKSMEGTLTITVTHRGRTHILHLSRYTEACIKRNTKHHLFESLTKALQVPQTEVEKVGKRSVRRWWDPKANNWFVDGYTYDGIDHQLYLPMELWTVFRHKYREWRDVELLWRALVREIWKVPADAPTTTVELSETPPTTIVSQADTIWTSPQHSEEGKATLIPQTYSRTTLSEQPGESWMTSLH